MLTRVDYTLGMLHVVQAERRHGLASVLVSAMVLATLQLRPQVNDVIRQAAERNDDVAQAVNEPIVPFVFIDFDNAASLALFEKLGFEHASPHHWIRLRF